MSHKIKMTVRNSSSKTLRKYKAYHEWHGHNTNIEGIDLKQGDDSESKEITSGYGPQYDNYTIDVTFEGGKTVSTNFYCNSSHKQNELILKVGDDSVDCMYYKNGIYDASCKNKHWTS